MSGRLRGFRLLMGFSFGASPRQATLFLLSGALMSLTGPAMAYGAKLLVDAVQAGTLSLGVAAAVLLAAFAAVRLVNTLYYVDLLFSVAERAGAAIDRRLMELVAGIPGLEHHERPEYLDQLDVLREERSRLAWMTNATAGMVRVAVQLVASGVLLAQLDPLLLLLPLVGVLSFVFGRRGQEWELKASEVAAEPERLRRHLFEVATSADAGKELRVFGASGWLLRRHRAASDAVTSGRDRASWKRGALEAADGAISGLAYVAAIGLVLVRAVQGAATAGDVVLAVSLAASMNAVVIVAVLYGTSFLRVLRLADRFLWLVDYAERSAPARAATATPAAKLVGGIDLEHVSFRYPGTEAPILDDVSLHLPAGTVVALVGENGAGKTTLVKLLCRFYEPTEGRITVDGVPLTEIGVDRWRERVSAAFQDFARFEFLARESVGVGDTRRIEDTVAVQGALLRAGAETLPARLPLGLETQLGGDWEGGAELSGGQWQKLALARTMMREGPALLILDEPTASLDSEAEHELFERYAVAARDAAERFGTVTLLVTHRFSTVRMAGLIVVLEHGRVREVGSHEQLVQQAGGLYAELYEMQARAYR